jgi:epoxyqueuosine reductase
MTIESIENPDARAEVVKNLALKAGFSCARFLMPFEPSPGEGGALPQGYSGGAPTLLIVALPYGNDDPDGRNDPDNRDDSAPMSTQTEQSHAEPAAPARIAPFARRNYYAEAVSRLKTIAVELRELYGGTKSDYRILCNSPIPEKPLAEASGLGSIGRNTLVITREAGSLVILAAMTLPFKVGVDGSAMADQAADRELRLCGACTACVAACPTGALRGDGTLDRSKCIQWYASGHAEPPAEIASAWGNILYGCTACLDACPHNRRPVRGVATDRGALPATLDAAELAALSDEELAARFRGTAMGMSWLGPAAIRRNARLAMERGQEKKA